MLKVEDFENIYVRNDVLLPKYLEDVSGSTFGFGDAGAFADVGASLEKNPIVFF